MPNSLWKTFAVIDGYQTTISLKAETVTHLEAWDEDHLYLLWDRNRQHIETPTCDLNSLKLVLIHQDYLGKLPADAFPNRTPYFRLINTNGPKQRVNLPSDFTFANVDTDTQGEQVAELIGQCYPDMNVSPEIVESWTYHPVFNSNLWIWVVDTKKDVPVGLGIGEFDPTVSEGSLEWVQVLPIYRGGGIGANIVLELLRRLQTRAAFTTVAGEVGNPTNPEGLYRHCGFEGGDIWWVLRSTR